MVVISRAPSSEAVAEAGLGNVTASAKETENMGTKKTSAKPTAEIAAATPDRRLTRATLLELYSVRVTWGLML